MIITKTIVGVFINICICNRVWFHLMNAVEEWEKMVGQRKLRRSMAR